MSAHINLEDLQKFAPSFLDEHLELKEMLNKAEKKIEVKPKSQSTARQPQYQSQPQSRIIHYYPPTTKEIIGTSLGYVGDILRSKKITDTVVNTADLVRYLLNQWE